ncbi:testis-expressed protein 26 [Astyanax mexicanus]|uniref:Testis-expressed protein 26 n=1 Tax=Astyanax mexicanus TaxID=7994 RepID=A0A8T2L0K4_ASTMX|nr:testis-expressed protein 26 [Astyanax mexicanus]
MSCFQDKKWDPYETSQRRDFVYRPSSSTSCLRPLTSQAYRNSYDLADPVGGTAYRQDYYWKPQTKPACIRSGSASGNSRNNPHPNQAFLVWRLARGHKLCENPPSEEEVRKVLSAQYRSTYRTDFLGTPQAGDVMNRRSPAPYKPGRDAPHCIQTEMRFNYRKPVLNTELQGNMTRYGCNALHAVSPKGIVPSVVHKHIINQESRKLLTTYDRHFGGKCADLPSVLRSLQPEELQHFCKKSPEKEKLVVQDFLKRDSRPPGKLKEMKESAGVSCSPAVLERMSIWPGPL